MLAAVLLLAAACSREEIGSVNTSFRITGSDKVVIEAFDDPRVGGVTCYVSRARTGGIKSWFGLAEDVSEAAIACRQVGEIRFNGPLPRQEDVFTDRMSVLFKTLHVVRAVDVKRNTLVYLTYSDKIMSGSPKNSVTAVPMPPGLVIPAEK
ncbi:MAG TPA: CreA family protein [Burkholderiaceae bacterium]|nr:CreA family protein [Burkholderiaceae bacterium]